MITYILLYILYAFVQAVLVARFTRVEYDKRTIFFISLAVAPLLTVVWIFGQVMGFINFLIGKSNGTSYRKMGF